MQYFIATTQKSPSMIRDVVEIDAVDYQDAVKKCQDSWRKTRRSTTLQTTEYVNAERGWHRINDLGEAVDRNTNSGWPEYQKLVAANPWATKSPGQCRGSKGEAVAG